MRGVLNKNGNDIRRITDKTLHKRERSEDARERWKLENWVLSRKVQWNEQINRMDVQKIVRVTGD